MANAPKCASCGKQFTTWYQCLKCGTQACNSCMNPKCPSCGHTGKRTVTKPKA